MHLVGYLYEDYHDARSLEHKANPVVLVNSSSDIIVCFALKIYASVY